MRTNHTLKLLTQDDETYERLSRPEEGYGGVSSIKFRFADRSVFKLFLPVTEKKRNCRFKHRLD